MIHKNFKLFGRLAPRKRDICREFEQEIKKLDNTFTKRFNSQTKKVLPAQKVRINIVLFKSFVRASFQIQLPNEHFALIRSSAVRPTF